MLIGLTGGIASGKSTVSEYLIKLGGKLIDSDVIARAVVQIGQPAYEDIKSYFGVQVIGSNQEIDRKKLAQIVFNDENELEMLNKIVHPRVVQEIEARIKRYKEKNPSGKIIVDVPLLLEQNLSYLVDEVWLVYVEKNTQIERLIKRNNITKEDALKIIDVQMSLEEKKQLSDILIDNNGTIEMLYRQLDELWQK